MTRAHSKIAFILDKSSISHNISFTDTGFCSMLATILPSCKTNPNSLTISRLMAFCHKIQSTMAKRKQQQSRFSGFTKVPSTNILNESIFASPYFQHGRPTTMFRASASNHRQHKHPSCRLCYRHALYQYAFALKAQSYKTTMFLNILQRGLVPPQKSYELKPIIRIVHTTSMQKSLTSFKIHSLPTNNSVDKQWTRYGQSVPISQIRKLIKKGLDTNHLMESLPFVLTPSTTKYEYWKRHTKKS